MNTVGDICDLIEAFAPLHLQESYDNAGLVLGDRNQPVQGVLIALDLSLEVLDEAIAGGFNLIVTHHPFIFKGIKTITGTSVTEKCLLKAIRHNLSVYAGHTNVDSVPEGVSGKMAAKLGLEDCKILIPVEAESARCGLGIVGNLPVAMNEGDFLQKVKQTFECQRIRHTRLLSRSIRKVALCGGAGSEFTEAARKAGADAYITGEARFHDFIAFADDILFVDAGHYETEQFTKEIFFEIITKKLPTFAVRISTAESNPVKYL